MGWVNRLAKDLYKINTVYTVKQWEVLIDKVTKVYISSVSSGVITKYISTSYTAPSVIKHIAINAKLGTREAKQIMDNIEIQSRGGYIPPEIIEGKKAPGIFENVLTNVSKTESAVLSPISSKVLIPVAIIAGVVLFAYLKTSAKGKK